MLDVGQEAHHVTWRLAKVLLQMKQSVGVIKPLSFFSVRNHAAAPSPGDGGGISRSFYITAAYCYVTDELLSHAAPAMTRLPSSVRSVCTPLLGGPRHSAWVMQPQVMQCDAWAPLPRPATSPRHGGLGVSPVDRPVWTHQRPSALTREGGKCVSTLNRIIQWFVQSCDPAGLQRVLHFRSFRIQKRNLWRLLIAQTKLPH